MEKVQRFPYEYILEVKGPGSEEFIIDTPWLDEDGNWQDTIKEDLIFNDESMIIKEQYYDNGFNVMFIQTADRIITKTNWPLDYIEKEGKYLPRIQ